MPQTAADFDFEALAPEDAIAFFRNRGYRAASIGATCGRMNTRALSPSRRR
jgi:hypothetical protein